MTEQELQEIERLFNDRGVLMRGILDDSYTCALPEEVMQAVPALIAEVRRLRERLQFDEKINLSGLLAHIEKAPPTRYYEVVIHGQAQQQVVHILRRLINKEATNDN